MTALQKLEQINGFSNLFKVSSVMKANRPVDCVGLPPEISIIKSPISKILCVFLCTTSYTFRLFTIMPVKQEVRASLVGPIHIVKLYINEIMIPLIGVSLRSNHGNKNSRPYPFNRQNSTRFILRLPCLVVSRRDNRHKVLRNSSDGVNFSVSSDEMRRD